MMRCLRARRASRFRSESFAAGSRPVVGSSRSRTSTPRSRARAIATRCRSPPDSSDPAGPTDVASPSGNRDATSSSPDAVSAAHYALSPAPSAPSRTFSHRLALSRKGRCRTAAQRERQDSWETLPSRTSSTRTSPSQPESSPSCASEFVGAYVASSAPLSRETSSLAASGRSAGSSRRALRWTKGAMRSCLWSASSHNSWSGVHLLPGPRFRPVLSGFAWLCRPALSGFVGSFDFCCRMDASV